ncbi:MAG: NADH-quinone oxidoreductase subunit A [Actinobacteria bacterium]|nr:MAG: NADH-quinone oxidoreductase subunit A [Actinomycetota bacterium]
MQSWHYADLVYMYTYIAVGIAFIAVALGLSRLVAPHHPSKVKNEPYECGEVITGQPWIQFNVRYYVFALLFLIFEVETVFLYPLAVAYKTLVKTMGISAFIEMGIFVVVLGLGLVYPWRKGILKWV